MLPWVLGSGLGVLPLRLSIHVWSLSAVFVGFSFIGITTVWRTRHSFPLKLGLLLLHLAAVALFLTPIAFGLWFISLMSEH